jgi:hypothetical protein
MGCFTSKEKREDIYKIVSSTAVKMNKDGSPSPNSDRKNASSASLSTTNQKARSSLGSRFGSSIMNMLHRTNHAAETHIEVDPLYVILPYFNYCGFKRRRELFMEFYERMRKNPQLRIVVCEAAEVGKPFELPNNLPDVFLHIHIHTKHQLWIKENLVNIAVRRLPTHWKYMAWLDTDIHFSDDTWVERTIERFEKYDVVQLFSTIVYLGPNNEAIKTDKGFGYMYRRSGKPYIQTYRYGFWHPGFAWACTKHAYQTMGGLIDYSILGSGDHHMALGLITKVECSHPKNIHPNYRKLLREFEQRVRTLRLGYIDGNIVHYWHGDLKLRRYKERWQILTEHEYDPNADVYRDPVGLYQLTDSGLRLHNELRDYFAGRLEDDTRVLS